MSRSDEAARSMVSAQKNIAVYSAECARACDCGTRAACALCADARLRDARCGGARLRDALLAAHAEHLRRGDFRRLFPPAMVPHPQHTGNI